MINSEAKLLGQLVAAENFYRFTVRVFKAGELEHAPEPADYRPGRFVKLALGSREFIVGLISDVMLVNPQFNELIGGMRQEHLETFSPDILEEQATFLSVVALGNLKTGEKDADVLVSHQNPVNLMPPFQAEVAPLSEHELRAFHLSEGEGGEMRFSLGYLPFLRDMAGSRKAGLIHSLLEELVRLFPGEGAKISTIKKNMDWELRMK